MPTTTKRTRYMAKKGLSMKQVLQKIQKLQRESSIRAFWVHKSVPNGDSKQFIVVSVTKEPVGGFTDFNFYSFQTPDKRESTFNNLVAFISE